MSVTVYRVAIFFMAACGVLANSAAQQDRASPIRAELLSRITARSVSPGDTVFARIDTDWQGDGCVLRRGDTVEATVLAAVPHAHRSRASEIALAFGRAECGGSGLHPIHLTLFAIAAPAQPTGELTVELPLAAQSETVSLQQIRPQTDKRTQPDPRPSAEWNPEIGQVAGIRGLRLGVATGPGDSSVLSSSSGDVELEAHTRLALVPVSGTSDADAASGANAESIPLPNLALAAGSPAISFLDNHESDLDTCVPPACPDPSQASFAATGGRYSGTIPLTAFGFLPRLSTQLLELSPDDALAWLGPNDLLVAFNPHGLVPRYSADNSDPAMRVIRAVLLDTSTHSVRKVVEWRTDDRAPYLWSLPGNRVLVHVENELRLYGAGLRIEKRIRLSGGLAFLRMTPDARRVAIGIIRERHQPTLHARLVAMLDHQPEEDVQLVTLDAQFHVVATGVSTTRAAPPVLLNEGEVTLLLPPGQERSLYQRYMLKLRAWNGAVTTLTQLRSTCAPQLSTVAPDLLFALSCDSQNHAPEYRFLRPDGKTVLHGHSLLQDMGHSAGRAASLDTFALGMFQADQPMLGGDTFDALDLLSTELAIYRATDGRRIFDVKMKNPAASSAGYAVSSSGRVAILGRDGVNLYSIDRR